MEFKVNRAENGVTLQQFLAGRLNISRNAAKALIDQRCVFVNDRRIWMARHCLKAGDLVEPHGLKSVAFNLRSQKPCFGEVGPQSSAKPAEAYPPSSRCALRPGLWRDTLLRIHPRLETRGFLRRRVSGAAYLEKHPAGSRAAILYEDHDCLIAGKPAGILSNGPKSLEEQLAARPGWHDLAACHRLDKDTSGCLIFAKHSKARERIITLFAQNEITKKYEAVIRGRLPKEIMTIAKPIDGRKAVTHIRVLDENSQACLASTVASHVSIAIETGRTHQIRKHLASIGHPVLGDQHYGVGREVPRPEKSIGRQMLHAVEIKFIQPFTKKPVFARAPFPADMKECLREYRLK